MSCVVCPLHIWVPHMFPESGRLQNDPQATLSHVTAGQRNWNRSYTTFAWNASFKVNGKHNFCKQIKTRFRPRFWMAVSNLPCLIYRPKTWHVRTHQSCSETCTFISSTVHWSRNILIRCVFPANQSIHTSIENARIVNSSTVSAQSIGSTRRWWSTAQKGI